MEKTTYTESKTDVVEEFQFHKLNEIGMQKSIDIANQFNALALALNLPQGRYRSLVMTKLEEACFFAKKSMATQKENQA